MRKLFLTALMLCPACAGTSLAPTPELAAAAATDGADYVGVGHVFATESKSKTTPPIGTAGLARVAAASPIPVIAIGGISGANLEGVLDTGVHGVAVIAAVCGADDPESAARQLQQTIDTRTS